MNLEASIRELAEKGTVAALEQHLPAVLDRFTQPADPDERLTLEEVAASLKMPVKTVRQRISEGRLLAFADGTRKYVLRRDLTDYNERLRAAAQFQRDQAVIRESNRTGDDSLLDLITPAPPARTAMKKARRS